MSDLDQQIRAVLAGYDHDAAGQIDHLTGAIRAVLDLHQPIPGLTCDPCIWGSLRPGPCPTIAAIATALGLTQETTS